MKKEIAMLKLKKAWWKYRKEYLKELEERIDKAIKYIEKYCIDDEFYINLTKKEKNIIEVLNILKGE